MRWIRHYSGNEPFNPIIHFKSLDKETHNMKQKKTILVVGGAGYIGSMANRSLLDRIFSDYHIDAVMHFASYCQVGESVVHPDIY